MKLFIKRIEQWKKEKLTDEEIHKLLPKQANENDAGYDIVAVSDGVITADKEDIIEPPPLEEKPTLYRRIAYIEYATNLYWTPGREEVVQVKGAGGQTIDEYRPVADLENHIEAFPRSSISKYNLLLANSIGTIDTGYQNQVIFRFKYVWQPQDLRPQRNEEGDYEMVGRVNLNRIYKKGDKIVQIQGRPNVPLSFHLVDELPSVDSRKQGGFGSSGN
jgi:dUTPase